MPEESNVSRDYGYVTTTARIAVYDDLLSAPRIIQIDPAPTNEFIESLASSIYDHSQRKGGGIPYSAIREVTENFIHADFTEIVVSILDGGNTVRFADQGPGIPSKEKAQLPGYTSATEPMKKYIRGVGSGLPLVKEYLSFAHGNITIEDNLTTGAVVTLSLNDRQHDEQPAPIAPSKAMPLLPPLTQREKNFVLIFHREGVLGVTDITQITNLSGSTVYNTMKSLEESGLLAKTEGRKRMLTDLGEQAAKTLL